MHHWRTSAIWRAGGACRSPCALLGCAGGWGATWLLVKQQLWWGIVEQPQTDATFQNSIADKNLKSPRTGKTLGCLCQAAHHRALPPGPACSPCQAEAKKTGMQRVKGTFPVCLFFQLSALANLVQKRICISAATAEVVAKFFGMLQPRRSKLQTSLGCA